MALGGISGEQSTVYQPVSLLPATGQEPEGGTSALAPGPGATPEPQPISPVAINPSNNQPVPRQEVRRDTSGGQKPSAVADTVNLSSKPMDVKQEARKAETAKVEPHRGNQPAKMGDILFLYTFRGDLRIRFLDSSNWLVYQIPPLMMSRMTDIMGRSALRVNMRA
jgi:hypothetical protein